MARWSLLLLSALLYVAVEGGPSGSEGRRRPREPTGPPPREWCPTKAERGDRGPPGDHGRPGQVGRRGITGEEGDYGLRGERGRKGERGYRGIEGEKGDSGWLPDGARGRVGQKGDTGEKGQKGGHSVGSQGQRGYRGERGDAGTAIPGRGGETGDRGDKGDKGQKGDSIKGSRGDAGAPGRQGQRGAQGRQGETPRFDRRCVRPSDSNPPPDGRDTDRGRQRRSIRMAEQNQINDDQFITLAGKPFKLETLLHIGFGWIVPMSILFVVSNTYYISTLRKHKHTTKMGY